MLLGFRLFLTACLCYIINAAKLFNLKDNDDKDVRIESNEFSNADLKRMKRIIVKRMVPHGYVSKALEFDNKFKTFYRPLVRYHKGKQVDIPIINDDENNAEVNQNENKLLDKSLNDKNTLRKLIIALDLLVRLRPLINNPVARSSDEGDFLMKMYEKYKNKVFSFLDKQFGSDSGKKKDFIERALKAINTFNDKKDLLSTLTKALRSLRAVDEAAVVPTPEVNITETLFLDPNLQTEKPKVELPHIPYWNYWTYEKTLYEDNCKHGWVRVHDMCLQLPPS